MATTKVTITLDQATITKLAEAAIRLSKPKSQVVREAIAEYHSRIGQLSDAERQRLLDAFDEFVPNIRERTDEDVRAELAEIRRARRSGGRRS
jgi:predicted transcriptional regulator